MVTLQERINKAARKFCRDVPYGEWDNPYQVCYIAGAEFGISLERKRVAGLVEASTKAYEAMTKLDWKGGAVGPQWLTDLFDAIAKWKEGE